MLLALEKGWVYLFNDISIYHGSNITGNAGPKPSNFALETIVSAKDNGASQWQPLADGMWDARQHKFILLDIGT